MPSVPAKPAKPPGLISSSGSGGVLKPVGVPSAVASKPPVSTSSSATGSGNRGVSRVFDAAFANTLAEALNKQPKPFGLKVRTLCGAFFRYNCCKN